MGGNIPPSLDGQHSLGASVLFHLENVDEKGLVQGKVQECMVGTGGNCQPGLKPT